MDTKIGGASKEAPFGIALGGGAARGLCHIGVLKTLSSCGIEFPVVTGTSMGAIIGAAYVCGNLAEVEHIARSVTARTMSGWADVNLSSGALKGDVVKAIFHRFIGDVTFEELREKGIRFTVVATDLDMEEPVYIDVGRVDDAVRASMSVPGVFEPITIGEKVLVDGGLIDNLPIGAARALGAEKVIGVEVYNPYDIWTRAALGVGLSVVQMREVKEHLQKLAKEQHVSWQRSLAAYKGASNRLARFADETCGGDAGEHSRQSEDRGKKGAGLDHPRTREFMSRLHMGSKNRSEVKSGEGWTAFRATLAAFDMFTSSLERGREPFRATAHADLFVRPDVRRFHAHQFYRASQLIHAGELAAIEALPEIGELMEERMG